MSCIPFFLPHGPIHHTLFQREFLSLLGQCGLECHANVRMDPLFACRCLCRLSRARFSTHVVPHRWHSPLHCPLRPASLTVFKPLVARWRPTHNPYLQDAVDIVNGYRGGPYGFFSSHAANTFVVATFLSPVFRRRSITLSLFGWAVLSCWTRVYLGAHYIGDLAVGALFGLAIGAIAQRFYRHYFSDARTLVYHPRMLMLIPRTFAITLCLIAIPWKLYF